MAPLKPIPYFLKNNAHSSLPCLKRHGSIEATWKALQPARESQGLPCLKRHGSIEALREEIEVMELAYLTMSEKTWLH